MKLSIKDIFSKCDQIRSFPWIWSHLLKKSFMENFIFCAVSRVFRFSLSKVINICFHGYLNIVCNKSAKKAGMVISSLEVLYMLHV